MEPTKTDIPPKPSIRPPAELTGKCYTPTVKLKRIQFGLLSKLETANISVTEENDSHNPSKHEGISKWAELFDPRLGVPNKDQKCATCNGTRRGGCDRPNSCDGHFGHIALRRWIYHPHFIRKCLKILSSICLGCSRVLEKKKKKNVLDALFEETNGEGGKGRLARKRKAGAGSPSGVGSRKRKHSEKGEDADLAKLLMQGLDGGEVKQEVPDSFPLFFSELRLPQQVKLEPLEFADSNFRTRPVPEIPTPPKDGHQVPRTSNDSQTEVCKYCGGPDGVGSKFPKIKVKLVGKTVGRRGRVDIMKLEVDEKAGVLPSGFWNFVNGHPTNFESKTRTLLPFEALRILKKIPKHESVKLDMDMFVSRPGSLIIKETLVSPNCNRLIMEDWSSTQQPKVLMGLMKEDAHIVPESEMRRGRETAKLEAIIRKVNSIPESTVKRDFAEEEQDAEDLQLLAARHFRACKVVEYKMATDQEIEETGGSLELKWLKANVLAKRSNHSARTVINGDPCILIGEIGIPKEVAQRLTVEEKVNSLNIRRWQKCINDYMTVDKKSMPGAFILKKKKEAAQRDLEFLRTRMQGKDQQGKDQQMLNLRLELGDSITRCLKDGDHVFANRPPSLHKHSIIALKAKVHPLSTFAINPLICPPFDADFDGDAFHIFVPQSLESIAELKELMSVTQQMICPQGGQPLLGLTQDSLVGAHLLTGGHEFISTSDMQQLSMWCSSEMPVPAIVKSPHRTGPLWTGKQLFSMTLPHGLSFGNLSWTGELSGMPGLSRPNHFSEGEVLIRDGEVLISQGSAKWLERSPNGIDRAICDHAGPVSTMDHLDCLQAVMHQWNLIRGFSVGLRDYHTGSDVHARQSMLDGIQKSLQNANEASLKQALKLDRQVQHRILFPQRCGASGSVEVENHQGCFGLLLGDGKGASQRVTALQGAAVERFQALAPIIENLVTGYMDKNNSLLAMVRSGSKGSISKLTQQAGCLGLQLYKGERILPVRCNNKLSYFQTSLQRSRADVFYQTNSDVFLTGYWESRGIIKSSYLDGLNPLEFFIDTIASRCNVMRQGIEEPNQILKNLMLFMRDMHIGYDGTVRNRTGQSIIQFQYGGTKTCPHATLHDTDPSRAVPACPSQFSRFEAADHWADSKLAGEPVGVLAATSIAEPAYNVRMQSIHQTQLLGAGPVQLLKEVLMTRSKTKLKSNDRRCILRLPQGFGKERRALEVQGKLQKVTVESITLASAIEFLKLDNKMYVKNGKDKDGVVLKPFKRMAPWMGHLLLCKKTLDENKLNTHSIVERLNRKHSGQVKEDSEGIYFSYSDNCISKIHPHSKGLCIWFFPVIPPDSVTAKTKEGYPEQMSLLLESMKSVMLPAVLSTTIQGSDDIERVRIVWEDSGSASRLPHQGTSFRQPSIYQAKRRDPGELVLDVVVNASRGVGKRGVAWLTVKKACVPVMGLIDWRRSGPYSVQEIYQSYGVEAARLNIIKRLTLATKNMGKPVLPEHLTLVADTMTHCGDVIGLGSAGYRDFCRHLSISTPFTEAAFQQPKKTFLDAAARGDSENIDGVLPSSVWGVRIPIGTGIAFQINSQVPKKIADGQTWPVDPLKLSDQLKESEIVDTKQKSLFNPNKVFCFKQRLSKATPFQYDEEVGCKQMQATAKATKRATLSQDGKQKVCKPLTERVEDRKRTPAAEADQRTRCKRGPDMVEEENEILDEPARKLHKKHLSQGLERVEEENEIPVEPPSKMHKKPSGRSLDKVEGGNLIPDEPGSKLQKEDDSGQCLERVDEEYEIPDVSARKVHKVHASRGLDRVEGENEIRGEPASILHKKLSNPGPLRMEGDPAILRVNDPRRVNWSMPGRSDVALTGERKATVSVANMDVGSKLTHCRPGEVHQEQISRKYVEGATPSVTVSVNTSRIGSSSKTAADGTSLVSNSKCSWSGGVMILKKLCNLFISSKNDEDSHEPEMEEPIDNIFLERSDIAVAAGTSPSTRNAVEDNHQNMQGTSLVIGSRGPTQLDHAHKEYEQLIIDETKELQNLLHVRYHVGERVQGDVEKMLLEKVLVHHPQQAEKIGCGVDYLKRTKSMGDCTKWMEDQRCGEREW